jgi:hypothetical protein
VATRQGSFLTSFPTYIQETSNYRRLLYGFGNIWYREATHV